MGQRAVDQRGLGWPKNQQNRVLKSRQFGPLKAYSGVIPEEKWHITKTVNLLANAFEGSNPSPTTITVHNNLAKWFGISDRLAGFVFNRPCPQQTYTCKNAQEPAYGTDFP